MQLENTLIWSKNKTEAQNLVRLVKGLYDVHYYGREPKTHLETDMRSSSELTTVIQVQDGIPYIYPLECPAEPHVPDVEYEVRDHFHLYYDGWDLNIGVEKYMMPQDELQPCKLPYEKIWFSTEPHPYLSSNSYLPPERLQEILLKLNPEKRAELTEWLHPEAKLKELKRILWKPK
ncbi:hypothetical protein ACFL1B_00425 [Nanoarchaeota archaeon]